MLLSLLGDPSSSQVEKHVIKRRTPDLYLLVRQGSLSDRYENGRQLSIVERDVDVSLVLELRLGSSRKTRAGSLTSATARPTRCFNPPERVLNCSSRLSFKSTSWISWSASR